MTFSNNNFYLHGLLTVAIIKGRRVDWLADFVRNWLEKSAFLKMRVL